MSLTQQQLEELSELASLPPDHPARVGYASTVATLDRETQNRWRELAREGDILRAALARMSMPRDLEENLLDIPSRPLPMPKPRGLNRLPRSAAAAILLVIIAGAGYVAWNNSRTSDVVVGLPPAPAHSEIDTIATLAVKNYLNPAPMDVESDQRETVRKALQAKLDSSPQRGKMPFPVAIPVPGAGYQLVGGAVRDFGGTTALETRWKNGANTYAVFQFAPAAFNLPQLFLTQRETRPPASPAMRGEHCHVAVWPGPPEGVCTWAVASNESASNDAFSTSGY